VAILVTGGCGFIGSHLVRRLLANDDQVIVLDNQSRGSTKVEGASYLKGDIRNSLMGIEYGVDEVIHLAYINGTPTFYSDPDLVLDVAVKGIVNVLSACKIYNIKKLTLVSSSEVCRAKLVDADETIPLVIPDPFNPRYSYSAGKIISEMMCLHSKIFERLIILRPFNIYGPGMAPGHVIPDFIEKLKKVNGPSASFEILGNGSETRSFCYIDDFIEGLMIAREKGEHKGIYNIGMPEETTIAELAYKMAHLSGRKWIALQESEQLREGDVPRRKPDISKLAALGYAPKVKLEEGLRRMIDELPSLQ
jgi:nucleoside-diphosphate-sugar epimerase